MSALISKSSILVLFFSFASATAQWSQTNGPPGADVAFLATDGSTTLAGTYFSGAFLSTDAGLTWSRTNNGLPNLSLWVGTSLGQDFFVHPNNDGLYVLVSGTTTWVSRSAGLPAADINLLTAAGSTLFVGLSQGLWKSTDTGFTWQEADSGMGSPNHPRVWCVYADIGGLLAGTNAGLYRSVDAGATWTLVSNAIPAPYVIRRVVTTLYVGTVNGMYFSTDNGAQWLSAGSELNGLWVSDLNAITSSVLVAAASGNVYRSADGGLTWLTILSVSYPFQMHSIVKPQGYMLASADAGGIMRSTDYGQSWTFSNSGLSGTDPTAFFAQGSTLYAGTEIGMYSSTDEGTTWAAYPNLSSFQRVTGISADLQNLYVSMQDVAGGKNFAYRSTNGGLSWIDISVGFPSTSNITLRSANGELFAPTTLALYQFNKGTDSWSPAAGLAGSTGTWDITGDGTNLIAASDNGALFSTDGGNSWTPRNGGFGTTPHLKCISTHGPVWVAAGWNAGIFRSTDRGLSWQKITTYPTVSQFAVVNATSFCTGVNGVFRSTDDGYSWSRVSTGLSDTNAIAIADAGSLLYVSTVRSGIWKRPLSELLTDVSKNGPRLIPETFSLEQNYPNPFNPTTVISYQTSVVSEVRLIVYDILGREVATLVNERQAPGRYEVTFDASGLASGVYVYRIAAGSFSEMQKMVLMK